jgi:hypothetical protein
MVPGWLRLYRGSVAPVPGYAMGEGSAGGQRRLHAHESGERPKGASQSVSEGASELLGGHAH